jgi:hypothetical protein
MSTGTTFDGLPVQGPHTVATVGNTSNIDGDLVSFTGICQSVTGIDITGTCTILLRSSQVNLVLPLADARGHRVHSLPQVNDQTIATGKVTAVLGSGPTATLTVLLTNSQQSVTVQANDVVATQSL